MDDISNACFVTLVVLCLCLETGATLVFDCTRGNKYIENGSYILATCTLSGNSTEDNSVFWSKFNEEIGFCHLGSGQCKQGSKSEIHYNLHTCGKNCFSLGTIHEPSPNDFGEYYIYGSNTSVKVLALNYTSLHRYTTSDFLFVTAVSKTASTPEHLYFTNQYDDPFTGQTPFSPAASHGSDLNGTTDESNKYHDDRQIGRVIIIVVVCLFLGCGAGISVFLVQRKVPKMRQSYRNNRTFVPTNNQGRIDRQILQSHNMLTSQSINDIQPLSVHPHLEPTIIHSECQCENGISTKCADIGIKTESYTNETAKLDFQCQPEDDGLHSSNSTQEYGQSTPIYNENVYCTVDDLAAEQISEDYIETLYSKPFKTIDSSNRTYSFANEPSNEPWYRGSTITDNTSKTLPHGGLHWRVIGGMDNHRWEDCRNRNVDICTDQAIFRTNTDSYYTDVERNLPYSLHTDHSKLFCDSGGAKSGANIPSVSISNFISHPVTTFDTCGRDSVPVESYPISVTHEFAEFVSEYDHLKRPTLESVLSMEDREYSEIEHQPRDRIGRELDGLVGETSTLQSLDELFNSSDYQLLDPPFTFDEY